MSLFSDVDWVILLGVGVFLLFGSRNVEIMRTFGRWYGRMIHLKQQLLSEVTKAADLPPALAGQPHSLRATLFGVDGTTTHVSGIPAVVTHPPGIPYRPALPSDIPWVAAGSAVPTWSISLPSVALDPEGPR